MRSVSPHAQRGATLIISLILLVAITLLAVSAINSNSTQLKITGNMQAKQAMNAAARQALETVLETPSSFTAPQSQSMNINGYQVHVAAPECLATQTRSGYSALISHAPEEYWWKVSATVTDPLTGATATQTQGVKILLPAGYC